MTGILRTRYSVLVCNGLVFPLSGSSDLDFGRRPATCRPSANGALGGSWVARHRHEEIQRGLNLTCDLQGL
jgi:hypothetical protein